MTGWPRCENSRSFLGENTRSSGWKPALMTGACSCCQRQGRNEGGLGLKKKISKQPWRICWSKWWQWHSCLMWVQRQLKCLFISSFCLYNYTKLLVSACRWLRFPSFWAHWQNISPLAKPGHVILIRQTPLSIWLPILASITVSLNGFSAPTFPVWR